MPSASSDLTRLISGVLLQRGGLEDPCCSSEKLIKTNAPDEWLKINFFDLLASSVIIRCFLALYIAIYLSEHPPPPPSDKLLSCRTQSRIAACVWCFLSGVNLANNVLRIEWFYSVSFWWFVTKRWSWNSLLFGYETDNDKRIRQGFFWYLDKLTISFWNLTLVIIRCLVKYTHQNKNLVINFLFGRPPPCRVGVSISGRCMSLVFGRFHSSPH